MEKKSIDDRAKALETLQRNVSSTRAGKPSEPGIIKVRRNLGFYDSLPWDQVQYFSRDYFLTWPFLDPGFGPWQVANYLVPQNQVLDITSVVFRAFVQYDYALLGGPPGAAFAHDTYLLGVFGYFQLRIAGTSIFDRDVAGTGIFAPGDAYLYLNQDIMVPQLPFHLTAQPGTQVTVNLARGAVADPPNISMVSAELRGLLIPKTLFDKLAKEFAS